MGVLHMDRVCDESKKWSLQERNVWKRPWVICFSKFSVAILFTYRGLSVRFSLFTWKPSKQEADVTFSESFGYASEDFSNLVLEAFRKCGIPLFEVSEGETGESRV